jgi:hypothetical protein
MGKLFQGHVTSVSVKGDRMNCAQLLFTVQDEGLAPKSMPFVALSCPALEPRVFSAMAQLVTAAYFAGRRISVGYKETLPTALAIEVFTPAPLMAKAKKAAKKTAKKAARKK